MSANDADPGWKLAIRGATRLFVPGAARQITRRSPALIAMRTYVVGAIVQWTVFGAFLAVLSVDVHPTKGALAVAILGVIDLALISSFRRRALPAEPKALRASFAQSFFAGYAFAYLSVIFGLIGFFVVRRGHLLIYLAGLPCGGLGLAMIAPTRARLERVQQRIRAQGSTLSLVEVLNAAPDPPPERPRRRP